MRPIANFLFMAIILPVLSAAAQSPSGSPSVAEVGGETITLQDLKQAAGAPLSRLEEQVYNLQQQKLQEMIADRLLAQEAHRRNISVEALTESEITHNATVTPEEIHNFYEANKNQLQKPEPEMQDQLRAYLLNQKLAARRKEFVATLQAQTKVAVHLEQPVPFRLEVKADGPSRGPAAAPVTIVEFEDFQCPFCKKVQATLDQVLARYGDKVRMVHHDFPLQSLHPASLKAHEAARCAEEQGKFWEFRTLLYTNAPAAGPEQLNSYATQAGLNVSSFKECVGSDKFAAVIKKDQSEGDRLGVDGTPAFFINGRLLSGSQPESEFSRIIDEELSKRAMK